MIHELIRPISRIMPSYRVRELDLRLARRNTDPFKMIVHWDGGVRTMGGNTPFPQENAEEAQPIFA